MERDPFVGTWALDPATLDYQRGRPGRRATYVIEALPNGLEFTLDGEDADGNPIRFRYGGALDGVARPLAGGDGSLRLALRRDGPRSVESVLLRGEQIVDRWTREVSADGREMAVTQHVRTAEGEFCNRSVYRRRPENPRDTAA